MDIEKTQWTILAIFLMIFGVIGFALGFVFMGNSIKYNKELPLGDVSSFVVDNKGNIYVDIGFYGKIQVYDSTGTFVRNWSVCCGTTSLEIIGDTSLMVYNARGDNDLYTFQGKFISSDKFGYESMNSFNEPFTDSNGKTYKYKGLIPRIVQTLPKKKVIVIQGLFLNLIRGPFPALGYCWIAFGFLFYRQEKLKKIKKNKSKH